jgi:hypothetical protein
MPGYYHRQRAGNGDICRINGAKNTKGRPTTPEQYELRALCKHLTPELLGEAKRLAFEGHAESTRLGATALLMAYGHGKPPQPVQNTVEGTVVLQVKTGVETNSEFGKWQEPAIAIAPPSPKDG